MKLKELHKDIERYLENDCYCPHEIYSFDEFLYQTFSPEDECDLLGERSELIICLEKKSSNNNQVIVFFKGDDQNNIVDAVRFDATENNLKIVKNNLLVDTPIRQYKFDEFVSGSTKNFLKDILSITDAVMVNTGKHN